MKLYKLIAVLISIGICFGTTVSAVGLGYGDNTSFFDLERFEDGQYVIYKNSDTGNIELARISANDIDTRNLMAEVKGNVEVTAEKEVTPGYDSSPKFGPGTGEDIPAVENTKLYLSETEQSAYVIKWILQENQWVPLTSMIQSNVICDNYAEIYYSTLPVAEVIYKNKTARPYYRAFSGEYYISYDTSKTYVNGLSEYTHYVLFSKDGINTYKKVEIPILGNMGISGAYTGNGVTLVFGMPQYTLHGTGQGSVYIFDNNCELTGTHTYSGYVRCDGFYNGYFYLAEEIRTDNTSQTIYKRTPDGVEYIEISEEEYNTASVHIEEQLHRTISDNMITFDSSDNPSEVYITDKDGNQYKVLYESESVIEPAGISISGRELGKIVRSEWMVQYADGVSIDYVYKIPLPPLNTSKTSMDIERCMWVTDEYVYIDQDIEYILRIPVSQLLNVPYVKLNGNILGFGQPPVIENGRTLVPMRFLFEQMGADVEWDSETQTATATLNDMAVTFVIDNTEAVVNGKSAEMDVPARLINGKTMVPLRFLSEGLGYTVTWDENSRMAVIE